MLLKKPGKKVAWIIAGSSFLVVLLCAAVVVMDHKKMGEERGSIDGLRTQISKAESRIRAIPDLETRVLRERAKVKENVKILPSDNDINTFVEKISEFAKAAGVEIMSLDDKSAKTRNQRKQVETFVRIVYKMSVKGTFAQFLDFVNRFENHDRFVAVNSYSIRADSKAANAKSKDGKEEATVFPHEIDLEVETYQYSVAASAKPPVDILNADQKLAKALREKPADGSLEVARYAWQPRPERRDPFADPRKAQNAPVEAKSEAPLEEELKRLEEIEAGFKKLSDALAKEPEVKDLVQRIEYQKRLNQAIVEFREKLLKLKKDEPFTAKEARARFAKNVDEPFAKILAERPDDVPELLAQEIEMQVEKMQADFDAGRHESVAASGRALLETKPAKTDEALAALFARADALTRRSDARIEFAKKSLAFGGLVYKHSNPRTAVVIINERAYSIGDVLDDGVVVKSIDPAKVVFLYKKEEITTSLD